MKSKRKAPAKPRNRESRNRQASLSQVRECRHMWMEGVCIKCGIVQNSIEPPDLPKPRND